MKKFRTALAAAAVTACALGLPATTAAAATTAEPAGPAWVRAAHLVPDLGRMDIDVTPFAGGQDGPATTVVQGAGYADVTGYEQFPAGFYAVAVRPAGSSTSTAAVVSGTVETKAGGAYTLAALGSGEDATIVPLVDDLTPPPVGQARIRVLSAASSAPAVDVSATDGPTVTTGAAFGTATGYTDVPAGTWTLNAQASGGSGTSGSTQVSVAAGNVYTLAVTDAPGGGLTVAPLTDAAGMAAVPVGGAATGAGGTAGPDRTALALSGAGTGLLIVGAGALWRRGRGAGS